MTRRAIFGVVLWICLVCAAAAQTLSFPALTGRVVDDAGLFDATTRAALAESLANLESKTTDQLVVVTLKTLQGTSIEDYGYQLGRRWQIGQKEQIGQNDKDNGVLLIVAPNERKVRIEVGYGLEGTLTDATTKLIIENSILPRFKTGDFTGGIKRGVADIIQVLNGDAKELQSQGAAQSSSENIAQPAANIPVWLAVLIILAGVGLLIYCVIVGGAFCRAITQILFLMLLSGRGGSSRGGASWSGGGGSFGGGGASGSW